MKDLKKKTKSQKKEEGKQARKFLKAKFNEKIGYWFVALGYFIKNNFKAHIKKIAILLAIVSFVMLIISIVNIAKMNQPTQVTKEYEIKNEKLERQLKDSQDTINNQNDKISEYDISNDSKIVEASNVIDDVFKGMYNITSSEEYDSNRKENLKLFKDSNANWVNKVYSDNKDDTGESVIDNLGLTSEIQSFGLYSKEVDPGKDEKINFKAIVEYQSAIDDVSNEYATRTHQSVFNIEVDSKDNKITNIEKENKLKTLNTVN
jgi:hypothetical protein